MPALLRKPDKIRAAFPNEVLAHAIASGAIAPISGSVLPVMAPDPSSKPLASPLPRKSARFGHGTPLDRVRSHLRKADPVMARLIDAIHCFDPQQWMAELPTMDLFGALLFQVTGQHLSVAAKRRTLRRIETLFGGQLPSPAELLEVPDDSLRQAGLSRRKVTTLRDLAGRFADGRLDHSILSKFPDDEVIAALMTIPGIGPWTAQGALVLALQRQDVVRGDIALRKALKRAYKLDHLPSEAEVLAIAEICRPYQSVATSYVSSSAFGELASLSAAASTHSESNDAYRSVHRKDNRDAIRQ